jgi:hypothetical protein
MHICACARLRARLTAFTHAHTDQYVTLTAFPRWTRHSVTLYIHCFSCLEMRPRVRDSCCKGRTELRGVWEFEMPRRISGCYSYRSCVRIRSGTAVMQDFIVVSSLSPGKCYIWHGCLLRHRCQFVGLYSFHHSALYSLKYWASFNNCTSPHGPQLLRSWHVLS